MGIFNTFMTREESNGKPRKKTDSGMDYTPQASANPGAMPITVQPTSFEDVYNLLNELKLGRPVIVDCSKLKQATAIRVIDILSGATYCLNGGWKAVATEIFLFAPGNAFSL